MSNIDYILDHRSVILSAYQTAEKSPSLTWQMLTGKSHLNGQPVGEGFGTLPGLPEVMKYDSFRTYLPMLESLGKRLDPGNIADLLDQRISAMEQRIVDRIDQRISTLEKKLDAVLDRNVSEKVSVSFPDTDDDCLRCADCVDDCVDCVSCVDDTQHTQDTQATQLTQIVQKLTDIEDSIESSRVWWGEIEQHVRGISEELEKKIGTLDKYIGELAKETDEALNLGRNLKQDVVLVMKQTAGLANFLTPKELPEYKKLEAEYDDMADKYENSKKIIATMKPGRLPLKSSSKFAEFRKQKGMSQQQLAEFLGVSRNSVANWESGRSNPPPDVIERLT